MDNTTEPRRSRKEPRHARSATDAQAERRYAATRQFLAVRRLENDGDRRGRELSLRLRAFDAREARVIVQLRAAGFLRMRREA